MSTPVLDAPQAGPETQPAPIAATIEDYYKIVANHATGQVLASVRPTDRYEALAMLLEETRAAMRNQLSKDGFGRSDQPAPAEEPKSAFIDQFGTYAKKTADLANHAGWWILPRRVVVSSAEGANDPHSEAIRGHRIYLGFIAVAKSNGNRAAIEWGKRKYREGYADKLNAPTKERRENQKAAEAASEAEVKYRQTKLIDKAAAEAKADVRSDIKAFRRLFRLQRQDNGLLLQLEAAQSRLRPLDVVRRNAHLQPGYAEAKAAAYEVARIQALLDSKMSREQQATLLEKQHAALARAERNMQERRGVQTRRMDRADKRHNQASTRTNRKLRVQALKVENAEAARREAYQRNQTYSFNAVNAALAKERAKQDKLKQQLARTNERHATADFRLWVYTNVRQDELIRARLAGIDHVPMLSIVRISYALSKLTAEHSLLLIDDAQQQANLAADTAATLRTVGLNATHTVDMEAALRYGPRSVRRLLAAQHIGRVGADVIHATKRAAERQKLVQAAHETANTARGRAAAHRRAFVYAQRMHLVRRAARMIET